MGWRGTVAAILFVPLLAACAAQAPQEVASRNADPFEASNRAAHEFNKKVDRALLRPTGDAYVGVMPAALRANISNLSDTLGTPKSIVNQLLQGDLRAAGRNTLRLAINLTVGIGGLGDAASEVGLPPDRSDFGETLAVWGVGQGAYLEIPFVGPSTERAWTGTLVDFALDPLNALPSPGRYYAKGVSLANQVGQRGQYADTFDSVLYGSADSYTQSKLIYLQNRGFELGEDAPADDEIDPMALDTEGF